MKILHISDEYTQLGGVEQYILSAGNLLQRHGHRNAVVYTAKSAHTIQYGPWPAYHVRTGSNVAAQVQKILQEEQPDLAYIHHVSSPELVDSLAGRLPSVAYVHGFAALCPGLGKYFRRGDVLCERPFSWACAPMNYLRRCSAARDPRTVNRLISRTAHLRQALLKASSFLVGSKYMAGLLAQNAFPPHKTTILPPHFLAGDGDLAYSPPDESRTILFAGRLEIEKGFPYLLRALVELPADVRLLVAGDGTQSTHYQDLAAELDLGSRVQFLGWLDKTNLSQALNRCALLVMPSIFPEPFGKSGIDALTRGRPVVAFDVGGISDWLIDGVTGLLARPSDSSHLAYQINALLADSDLREMMGRTGQKFVLEHYASNRHLAVLEKVFQQACSAWPEDEPA